jgi:imidazolonepropionase-like amidohydrolase
MLTITGGTVVDADGTRSADVAVEDGEIVAIGDVPETEETIDADGAFVTPGLIDAHVHLSMEAGPDPEANRDEPVEHAAYVAAANLERALSAGVTTVRDLGARGEVAVQAREAVADGTLDGPRVHAARQNVVMTGGHGHWFGREADGPTEVRTAAREQLKGGADVVKCMATGGVLTEGAGIGAPELTPEELAALVDAAAAKGVPTAAHAHGATGIENAARAGITSVEHGTFMNRSTAETMAAEGTYWVPTASALHGIVDNGVEAGIPEWAVEKAEHAAEAFDEAFDHALAADVDVAMGTDAGTPFNAFADIPTELSYMVEHGLSPTQALEAATVNAADLLGLDDVGLVAEGYRADLLVLTANPLADAEAWTDPEAVVADGERHR